MRIPRHNSLQPLRGLVFALLLGLVNAPAQQLIELNDAWKYLGEGIDPGPDWTTGDYDDSEWPSGPAPLGYPFDEPLPLSPIQTVLARDSAVITHHFRTRFLFTGNLRAVLLVSTNLIDDGAIFYLNGQEALRVRLPEGFVGPATYATATPSATGDAVAEVLALERDSLIDGENVLAVRLHQFSSASSDAVFACALVAVPTPDELEITVQPVDATVAESRDASLSVSTSGYPHGFEWYRVVDGVPVLIPEATEPTYVIGGATASDEGDYFVVVTNATRRLQSRTARLNVTVDNDPPLLLSADGSVDASTIVVWFDEPMSELTATNVGNYVVTNNQGGMLTIETAVLSDRTNVVLTTSPRLPGNNYLLIVDSLREESAAGHVVAPGSMTPVSFVTIVMPFDGWWDYFDPVFGLDPEELSDTEWRTALDYEFGPNYWARGRGALAYSAVPEEPPVPVNTPLVQTRYLTSNFRSLFEVPPLTPSGLKVTLRHVLDDGAIVYLNGTEVLRFNLPGSIVSTNTKASIEVDLAESISVDLPAELIRAGTNLLAAELHQVDRLDVDKVFALELAVRADSYPVGPPIIVSHPEDQTVVEGRPARFTLRWIGAAAVQWLEDGVEIPGATNASLLIPRAAAQHDGKQYSARFRGPSSEELLTRPAVLHVARDLKAPEVLGAELAGAGILITFDEPLDDASSVALANYAVTNCSAGLRTVASVSRVDDTSVLLVLTEPFRDGDFVLVSQVGDRAIVPNRIDPPVGVAVGFGGALIAFDSVWKFDESDTDLGTAWREPGFDDALWRSGPGLLGFEAAELEQPIITELTLGAPTYYFRTRFEHDLLLESGDLELRYFVDDGAVFYLNGVEFHSVRMNPNPTHYSFATDFLGDAFEEGPIAVPPSLLVPGENVLAVEVHQERLTSSDIVLGVQLGLPTVRSVRMLPPIRPDLRIERLDSAVRLSWPELGIPHVLEQALRPDATWVALPPSVTAPGRTSVDRPSFGVSRFFRLRPADSEPGCWYREDAQVGAASP